MKKRFLSKVLATTAILATLGTAPVMAGQWQLDYEGWWYENDDGSYPKNQWFQDTNSGKWYYAGARGYMLSDAYSPDGYYVSSGGALDDKVAMQTETTEDYLTKASIKNVENIVRYLEDMNFDKTTNWKPESGKCLNEIMRYFLSEYRDVYSEELPDEGTMYRIDINTLNDLVSSMFGHNQHIDQEALDHVEITDNFYYYGVGDWGDYIPYADVNKIKHIGDNLVISGMCGAEQLELGTVSKHPFIVDMVKEDGGRFNGYTISRIRIFN